jgi:hypothetical protein
MKLPLILLIFVSIHAYAEEDCIFDETAYVKFINKYTAEHRNSTIDTDGKTLTIKRKDEDIVVKGGGCVHLGVAIELTTRQAYTEKQFLQKVLGLSNEFGNWLINTSALKKAINKGKYTIIDGEYFVEVDAMTVFSASHDNKGKINVDFYIN